MKNFIQNALNNNSIVHGLLMAAIGAITGTIYPFVNDYLTNAPTPSIKEVLQVAAKAAIGACFIYLTKNGIFKSSNPNINQ